MPLPQTIGNEIISELNGFVSRNQLPDPFTQSRLGRQIEKLKSVNPSEAYLCLAILETLKKDIAGVRKNFNLVFSYQPNDSSMLFNYAGSLVRLSHLNEAIEKFMQALSNNRANRKIIIEIANLIPATLRIDILHSALEIYTKATQDDSVMDDIYVRAALDIASTLEMNDVSTSTANSICQAAESVVLAFSQRIHQMHLLQAKEHGGSVIALFADIKADPDTVSEMNLALADELVDRDLLHLLPTLTYAFTPA